jgi:hypothetical protein
MRCGWPGTRRRSPARSTNSPTPTSPLSSSTSSVSTCETSPARPRWARSVAPSCWRVQIVAWHQSAGEQRAHRGAINLIKRIGFGFRRFTLCPDPGAALRRQAQLGPTRDSHSPLKSDEPDVNEVLPALEGDAFAISRSSAHDHQVRNSGPRRHPLQVSDHMDRHTSTRLLAHGDIRKLCPSECPRIW